MARSQDTIDKINALLNHPSTHPNIKAAAKARLDAMGVKSSNSSPPPKHSQHSFYSNMHDIFSKKKDPDKYRYKNATGDTHQSTLHDFDYEHVSSEGDKHVFKRKINHGAGSFHYHTATLHGPIDRPHSFEVKTPYYRGSGKTVNNLEDHLHDAWHAEPSDGDYRSHAPRYTDDDDSGLIGH